jgi:hypothetical protein
MSLKIETLLFQANLSRSKVKVPKRIKWNQLLENEIRICQQLILTINYHNRYTRENDNQSNFNHTLSEIGQFDSQLNTISSEFTLDKEFVKSQFAEQRTWSSLPFHP